MALTQIHPQTLVLTDLTVTECLTLLESLDASEIALQVHETRGYLNFAPLCFKKRIRSRGKKAHLVDVSSYDADQAARVKMWITSFVERYYYEKASSETLRSEFYSTLHFINFSENSGHGELTKDSLKLHKALINFSAAMKKSISVTRHTNTAHCEISTALKFARVIFPDSNTNFLSGLHHIPYSKDAKTPTEVPTQNSIDFFIKPLSDLFINLCSFLSGEKTIPHSFRAGGETIWILSGQRPILSESVLQSLRSGGSGSTVWSGAKNSIEDMMEATGDSFHGCLTEFMTTLESSRIIEPSNNSRHKGEPIILPATADALCTYQLCRLAHNCFLHIFALVTGANQQPISDLIWDEFSVLERGTQNQRVIKNRAQLDINVSFQARFSKEFELYLAVRNTLIGDYEFKQLFGDFSYNKLPTIMSTNTPHNSMRQVKRNIFPNFDKLGLKELRAFNLHFKSSESGIDIAAQAGGHSPTTALQSYSSGNFEINMEEATVFFTAVGDRAREVKKNSTAVSSGSCSSNMTKITVIDLDHGVEPDCKNFLGCLFCEHLFLHINEVDIRKLLSMHYIIEQLELVQQADGEFEEMWAPSLARLNLLILKISEISDETQSLIGKIRSEVYEHEMLDPYWDKKLNILVTIGVLT